MLRECTREGTGEGNGDGSGVFNSFRTVFKVPMSFLIVLIFLAFHFSCRPQNSCENTRASSCNVLRICVNPRFHGAHSVRQGFVDFLCLRQSLGQYIEGPDILLVLEWMACGGGGGGSGGGGYIVAAAAAVVLIVVVVEVMVVVEILVAGKRRRTVRTGVLTISALPAAQLYNVLHNCDLKAIALSEAHKTH